MWEFHPLENVCAIIGGGTPSKSNKNFYTGNIPWATVRDMSQEHLTKTEHAITAAAVSNSSTNVIPAGKVVIATRVGLGKVCILGQDTAINQDLRGVVPITPNTVDDRFLLRWFQSISKVIEDEGTGATVKGVRLPFIKSLQFPLPPLEEQQRIVDILDEAFAGIDAAIENTKRNLVNARELFESYLNEVFTKKGDGWVEKTLSELIEISHGYAFKGSDFGQSDDKSKQIVLTPGNYMENGRLSFAFKKTKRLNGDVPKGFLFDEGDLTVVMTDLSSKMKILGKPAFIDRPNVLHNQRIGRILLKSDEVIIRYIFFFLRTNSVSNQIKDTSTGTMVRHTAPKRILANLISFSSDRKTQYEIVSQLDELEIKTQKLEDIYRQKLASLTNLKHFILRKAFSGELTASVQTASPEFSAHILAFAYDRHHSNKRNRTFGRVKAQKTLHLVESIGDIDLGRVPIKDAAGPNDSAHMRRAENWAATNEYFEFVPRGDGYDFKQRSGFDKLLVDGRVKFGRHKSKIEHIVDLLLPMNSLEAEVFATVHAAWNNLVSDGAEATDQRILWEARDNWHSDKLNIPEEEFIKAIRYVRSNNLIPDGTAKVVKGQETLF